MTVDPNAILMGGGVPPAKFNSPGVTYGGRITTPPQAYQEREYVKGAPGTGKLKTFDSGDPIMGLTVDIQTTLRDPSIEDDDGMRRIYISGKRMKTTVRDAVRAAGAPGLEVGGELTITYTHSEVPTDPQSAKHYTATYVPAASATLMGETPAGAAPPVTTPAAAPTPTPTPAAALTSASGVDQNALLAALGNLPPEAQAALLANAQK